MVSVGLFVRMQAKPGKEAEWRTSFVGDCTSLKASYCGLVWNSLGPSTFGIFDVFPDEAGRQAHLTGKVATGPNRKSSRTFRTTSEH